MSKKFYLIPLIFVILVFATAASCGHPTQTTVKSSTIILTIQMMMKIKYIKRQCFKG